MQKYSPKTLADARRIAQRYRLEQLDWSGLGTPNGFANFLVVRGEEMTIDQLAMALRDYKSRLRQSAIDGKDLDAELALDAGRLDQTVGHSVERRTRLAALVHEVKYGTDGYALWSSIAYMATTRHPFGELDALDCRGLMPQVDDLLRRLRDFEEAFPDCLELGYEPEQDEHMDFFVKQDIERLDDIMLHAESLPADAPDPFHEVGALLSLARSPELLEAVRLALRDKVYQRDPSRRQT